MEGPWCHPPEADGKPQNRFRWGQPEESWLPERPLGLLCREWAIRGHSWRWRDQLGGALQSRSKPSQQQEVWRAPAESERHWEDELAQTWFWGFKRGEAWRTTSRFLSWRAVGREVLMVAITWVDCVTDIIVSASYRISHLTFTITLWDWDCCFFSKWGKQDTKVLNNLPNITQLLPVDVTLNSWQSSSGGYDLDHCAVWTPGHRWCHRCLS